MTGKMSATEFSCAASSLRLSPDALAAARRVLVDGATQYRVGHDSGASRQTINYWVSRVVDAHEKLTRAMHEAAPAGWSVAIIALPDDQMRLVKVQEEDALNMLRIREAENG